MSGVGSNPRPLSPEYNTLTTSPRPGLPLNIVNQFVSFAIKKGLYRSWCGVNRLGDSGVHTLGNTSAVVNLTGQLLLTRR